MNPGTKAYEVLKYLLAVAEPCSHTWADYVRGLFIMYRLPDPLELLSAVPVDGRTMSKLLLQDTMNHISAENSLRTLSLLSLMCRQVVSVA